VIRRLKVTDHAEIAASKAGESLVTRTNPGDGGEWVANVQGSPILRDPGGQQSRNVTSE
jgi:hypothetical protein